jgi:choice-of-anchor C domain-containing protein
MNAPLIFRIKVAVVLAILTLAALLPSSAQIQNGSFETPSAGSTYTVFFAGNTLPGWTVESGTVEVVGTYWQAAAGSQSLDLNGIWEDIGTIYQDVATVPGESYRIRFALAGNPEGGPTNKTLNVFWQGELLSELVFDITGHSVTNMGWQYQEYTVVATGTVARLRFQSTCSSFLGPTLDDISVTSVHGITPTNPPPATNQSSVVNGGFELPSGISTYEVFMEGWPMPNWVIESGTVEIVGPYWQAAEGSQSLDLNGIWEDIGTIYQDVPTVPGETYRIRFAMAGNPEGGPVIKTMKAFWQGELLEDLAFDTTGHSVTNMGWGYHEYTVVATGAVARLRFQSTCSSFLGPTLDDISVTSVHGITPTNPPPPPPEPPVDPPTTNYTTIGNWGFEQPPDIGSYAVFMPGTGLPGWVIESGTVEIVGPYWQAAEGSQSLDLNGIWEDIGTIYKDIATTPAESYRVRFAMAGNPEGGPVIKTMKAFWQGELLDDLAFDTTGHSVTNMGWGYHEYTVAATGAVTRLKFQSTSSSFCGPTLDDISVTALNGGIQPTNSPGTNIIFPPLPPVMQVRPTARAASGPNLLVHGERGKVYRIEMTANPVTGPWTTVTNLVMPAGPLIWSDPEGANAPIRFYRAVLVR